MNTTTATPIDVAHELLAAKLGVAGIIKLRMSELLDLPQTDAHFFHINAAPCTHRAGETYAAVAIAASESDGAPQTLLYPDTAKPVRVVETVQYENVASIPPEVISRTIGRPASARGLIHLLFERYGAMRGWTRWDAANRAVVLSRLSMVVPAKHYLPFVA
jgi:hypothetical protein